MEVQENVGVQRWTVSNAI